MFDFPAHYIAHREEAPDGGPGPGDPEAGWQALYEIGRLARLAGKTPATCPRPPFTLGAVVWLAGFTGSAIVLDYGTA